MITPAYRRDGEYRFEFAGIVRTQIAAVPAQHKAALGTMIERIAADPDTAGHIAAPPSEPAGRRVYRKLLEKGKRYPRLIIVFRVLHDEVTILVDQIRFFASPPEDLTDE